LITPNLLKTLDLGDFDGTTILHDRERFSHELTLVFASGKTQILTHEKKERE